MCSDLASIAPQHDFARSLRPETVICLAVVRQFSRQPRSALTKAADAAESHVQYKAASPGVVIMDITIPGRGGIAAAQQLRKPNPSAQITIHSMHATATYAIRPIRAGAKNLKRVRRAVWSGRCDR